MARCPGLSCSSFAKAQGATWEEKAVEACTNCTKCGGNFPLNPDEEEIAETGDYDFLIAEIFEIARDRAAGFKMDFDSLGYVRGSLLIEWINAENEMRRLWGTREQAFYKAHFKK